MISLKSKRELDYIRSANAIVAEVLMRLERLIEPGITTKYLDDVAEKLIRSKNAIPAFKNYRGYPASICASVNEELVHGIPSMRKLKDGDIISVDVGVRLEGYYGDAARTWGVGSISDKAKKLIRVTEESFFKGIVNIKPGCRLGDLSHGIQEHVEKNNFSIVRSYVGHGIGQELHEEPQIPNYGLPKTGIKLENGMTLAIEPMVNHGVDEVEVLEDGWTVVTVDRQLSAHYENTIAIVDDKVEVLTLYS